MPNFEGTMRRIITLTCNFAIEADTEEKAYDAALKARDKHAGILTWAIESTQWDLEEQDDDVLVEDVTEI